MSLPRSCHISAAQTPRCHWCCAYRPQPSAADDFLPHAEETRMPSLRNIHVDLNGPLVLCFFWSVQLQLLPTRCKNSDPVAHARARTLLLGQRHTHMGLHMPSTNGYQAREVEPHSPLRKEERKNRRKKNESRGGCAAPDDDDNAQNDKWARFFFLFFLLHATLPWLSTHANRQNRDMPAQPYLSLVWGVSRLA